MFLYKREILPENYSKTLSKNIIFLKEKAFVLCYVHKLRNLCIKQTILTPTNR